MYIDDDKVAGGLLILVSFILFIWYVFVSMGLFRVSKTHPPFVFFFSQSFCDIWYTFNGLWFGFEIFFSSVIVLPQGTKWYSFLFNMGFRPVKYHYLAHAVCRFIAVYKPTAFAAIFTRKFSVRICVSIWLLSWIEVIIWHSLYPPQAYIDHNIQAYGFISLNGTYYLSTVLPTYLTMHNYVLSSACLLLYAGCVACLLSKKVSGPQRTEIRMLIYCFLTNLSVMTPTLIRFFLLIMTKWGTLASTIFNVIIYDSSAILLPIFSKDLRMTLFGRSPANEQSSHWSTRSLSRSPLRSNTLTPNPSNVALEVPVDADHRY